MARLTTVDGVPTPMIETAFHGPTDARGARVKAWTVGGGKRGATATIGWDYAVDSSKNHENAVLALVAKQWPDWDGYKLLYCSRDGGGYVFAVVWGAS